MNSDIEFLKKLKQELKTQENDYQASPRFWVIKDYKWVTGNENYDDGRWDYYYNDGEHDDFPTKESLVCFIERYYEDELDQGSNWYDEQLVKFMEDESKDLSDLFEYMLDHYNGNGLFGEIFMREESFISSNSMFITKQDAENHLKLNRHHYSAKAHVYCMTAWRSPKVERLWNILENFDWNKLD